MGYFNTSIVTVAAKKDNVQTSKPFPLRLEHYPILYALAQLETGLDDKALGKKGEVSRYQMLPSTWKEQDIFPLDKDFFQESNAASQVAEKHIVKLTNWFKKNTGRNPSPQDLYVMWNTGYTYYLKKGFVFSNVNMKVKERANRYYNLYVKAQENLVAHINK